MEDKILEISGRIRALREMMGLTESEVAEAAGVSLEEYNRLESGQDDFSFTVLYHCAETFGVDIVELVTGDTPKLRGYSVVRRGGGLPIKRERGFEYNHLAYLFEHKLCEPFLVKAPYRGYEQEQEITVAAHEGQEFDYILKGSLKVIIGGHVEVLGEGDAIYYDSSHMHGMIATGGEDCEFLAVVLKP